MRAPRLRQGPRADGVVGLADFAAFADRVRALSFARLRAIRCDLERL
jgi:hypothetical protein